MKEKRHLSLEMTLTSLYAPEIRCKGSSSSIINEKVHIEGYIGDLPISIIHASGSIPHRDDQNLLITKEDFSFILAPADIYRETKADRISERLRSFAAGLYPFESKIFELTFSGVNFALSTSVHIEIPHYLTRFHKDTVNLHHVFSEGGLRAPSYMGGICEEGQKFQMHLHYKSIDAFRRIASPALTMIAITYLNLAAVLAGGTNWRDKPAVIFGMLSINAIAFATLASIRVGSTLRSLLNMVRLIAVMWVITLTVAVRTGGLPGLDQIADIVLKGCIVWLTIVAIYAFIIYPLEADRNKRKKKFAWLFVAGLFALGAFILSNPLAVAISLSTMLQ